MKFIHRISQLILTFTCSWSAFGLVSAAEKVHPAPEKFPFGFYSVGYGTGNAARCRPVLEKMKESGVSLLGPYYGKDYDALKDACYQAAADLKLDSIYYIPIIEKKTQRNVSFLQPEVAKNFHRQNDLSEQVDQQVELVFSKPALAASVKWWGVMPEELRSWRAEEMEYLGKLVGAIRAAEKKRGMPPRPVMLYEPSNRQARPLETTGRLVDVQAIGAYTRDPSDAAVVSAIKTSSAAVTQASRQMGTYPVVTLTLNKPLNPSISAEEIERSIRRNTYIALVSGARGILIWSWATRPGLSAADRDVQAAAYTSVAHELNGPLNLGQVLLHGKEARLAMDHSPHVLTRTLAHGGATYAFFVNTGRQGEKVMLGSAGTHKPVAVVPARSAPAVDGGVLVVPPGGTVVLKF